MRILVAPDKFKGTLSAKEAAEAIATGLREALPRAEVTLQPMADGGEGTAEIIAGASPFEWRSCEAHDAMGGRCTARFAVIEEGRAVVLETSEAIGLRRIPSESRDPMHASSRGAGEMIRHAAAAGPERIILGLGGSATNDGGFGLARALGYRFRDANGNELIDGPLDLLRLQKIEPPASPLRLPEIIAAVDVRNPLLGTTGATRVYAAQKGATPGQVEQLEAALSRLADIAARAMGSDHRDAPGAGAAGGLGFGLATFCGAELRSGFALVAEAVALEAAVRAADVVVTGEGRLDGQSLNGKVPVEVARLARRHGRRCLAIVGQIAEAERVRPEFDGVFALHGSDMREAARAAASAISMD